ncbi:type III pantothenate kinase [Methylobacter sp. S3L5C]|uniref:type III pantothenate kinase n=1 Tax=Methylobacter sp. S3L5C TaxID=2839024 RepID=UPI001FACC3AB|nr:type III pantothenate kinase [Methylobacter sp. S3L5C]UOA08719.1 type III pantothenate kinase [Methylobacter sp. S3L5C]
MNLLIDSGNTRLKWAMLQEDGLFTSQAMLNQQLTRQQLIAAWKRQSPPKRLAIACVGKAPLLKLVLAVAVELWPAIEIMSVKSEAKAFGVVNAYQQPENLGVDRWLALVAVRHHYQNPACIVDCGTAITVDLIDGDGNHQGGLISPGLTLMKQSLATSTAALQFNQTSYLAGPACFTQAAIYSGTLMAATGLIEQVLSQQHTPVQLIITGGDADIIAAQLKIKPIIDTDLVLRGLAIVLEGQR